MTVLPIHIKIQQAIFTQKTKKHSLHFQLLAVRISTTLRVLYNRYDILTDSKPPHPALTAFSLRCNLTQLFRVPRRAAPGTLTCVFGIRVLSLAWVMLGDRYYIQFYMPNINVIDLFQVGFSPAWRRYYYNFYIFFYVLNFEH